MGKDVEQSKLFYATCKRDPSFSKFGKVELTTEVSVKLSDPLPSRHPTKMHIDVHSKTCGRQQHSVTAPA